MKKTAIALAASLALFALAGTAQATVLRVVQVETSDVTTYMKDLAAVQAHRARAGSKGTMRAWRARFAGPNAGAIVVAIEYANMADLAADEAVMAGDAQLVALFKAMDSRRKIVSDSLYTELEIK